MKYSFGYADLDDVERLIDKRVVNPRHKIVLKMRFVDGMTYKQIADNKDSPIHSEKHIGKIIADYAPKLKSLLKD